MYKKALPIFSRATLFALLAYPLSCISEQSEALAEAVSKEATTKKGFLAGVARFLSSHKEQELKLEQPEAEKPQPVKEVKLDSRFEVGANYSWVSFHPHGHHSFHGNLGGMQALYEYRPTNFFYGAGKFTWREGNTHGSAGRRSMLYIDAQERMGYTFASEKQHWRLSLFSGLGFRHVAQKYHPKDEEPLWFKFNEFYVPLGTLFNYDVNSWFACGVDFTWMPQIYPTVTIVPLKGSRWVLTKTLANFYVELPLTFTVTQNKRFQILFNPFYEHWQDGHSTAKISGGMSLGLPGNTYNFYGAELNFAYRF